MTPTRWRAEPHRPNRKEVALIRPGDGRPDSDPWADPGCAYIFTAEQAREIARQLISAADAVEKMP